MMEGFESSLCRDYVNDAVHNQMVHNLMEVCPQYMTVDPAQAEQMMYNAAHVGCCQVQGWH